ncbi:MULTISPECIES: hypothetical protein [Nonomuraea]|uniref:Uncharacterized protein n=2 Tax=Nonomuraea TaxID=83681 RepID=A0A7W5VLC4_9ACTN|nr:hypothetical protein [Nonomuraea dietziae]MBB3733510.1 hypothetical protein [Nonomuraea dietziae]
MKFFRRDREPSRRSVEDVDLDSLLSLVADSLGYTCVFARDGGSLTLGGGREILVRLAGLRREAGRRSREDWPVLVSEHLANAVAAADDLLDVCDLDQVKPLLRTRVESVDAVEDLTRVVGRSLNGDLVELLTVGARFVRPEEAGCWPIPSGQALDLALANVREDERLAISSLDLSGLQAWRLSGRTVAAAAHLRWLSQYVSVPEDGMLVILPDPATLVVYPVDGIGVVRAIERMRVHAERAAGLSQQVYWWHEGRLTLIRADIVIQDGQARLVVAPPPEFARVLARLAA